LGPSEHLSFLLARRVGNGSWFRERVPAIVEG
jgi:hypothetical protein